MFKMDMTPPLRPLSRRPHQRPCQHHVIMAFEFGHRASQLLTFAKVNNSVQKQNITLNARTSVAKI